MTCVYVHMHHQVAFSAAWCTTSTECWWSGGEHYWTLINDMVGEIGHDEIPLPTGVDVWRNATAIGRATAKCPTAATQLNLLWHSSRLAAIASAWNQRGWSGDPFKWKMCYMQCVPVCAIQTCRLKNVVWGVPLFKKMCRKPPTPVRLSRLDDIKRSSHWWLDPEKFELMVSVHHNSGVPCLLLASLPW